MFPYIDKSSISCILGHIKAWVYPSFLYYQSRLLQGGLGLNYISTMDSNNTPAEGGAAPAEGAPEAAPAAAPAEETKTPEGEAQ